MAASQTVTCERCHYWQPLESMPSVGECCSLKKPVFADQTVEACFLQRSSNDLEFMWCRTHRRTIHSTEFADHRDCSVFVAAAKLPVEDLVEFTMAGD